ncbi:hypothetical protein [Clostridium sp.]|uniref:hypothetical protein n=1 Tax=Clostridium sp. TaxID=1506 RepID=UPI0028FFFD9E|nr:hypothetical protein [Clostridium sp.]MDU2106214.1 hypothetical protein [Clostridium sp.]MDU3355253.1 hypothetical protein [Clostridium sp.]
MRNKGKNNNNSEKNDNEFINSMLWLIGFMILLAIVLGVLFKYFDKGNQLDIINAFDFAGSFGGAVLGAGASLVILSITSINQRKDINDQRDYDKKIREEDFKRYEDERKIQIEKENLVRYKNHYGSVIRVYFIVEDLFNNIFNDRYEDENKEYKNLRKEFTEIQLTGICIDNEKIKTSYNALIKVIESIILRYAVLSSMPSTNNKGEIKEESLRIIKKGKLKITNHKDNVLKYIEEKEKNIYK